MTPEQLSHFECLSPTTQAFLARVARRLAETFYEGEVILNVKRGRDSAGKERGNINLIRWTQIENGDTLKIDER